MQFIICFPYDDALGDRMWNMVNCIVLSFNSTPHLLSDIVLKLLLVWYYHLLGAKISKAD